MAAENLRIIYDNAADRGTLTASSQVGALVVSNLRNDIKTHIWRSIGTVESLTMIWPTKEPISGAVLGFSNCSPRTMMRARSYDEVTDLTPQFDTDYLPAAPIPTLGTFGWGDPLGEHFYVPGGASMFAYGFGSYARIWFPEGGYAGKKLVLDITDPGSPNGYIEASRLFVGRAWSPRHNFDFGNTLSFEDQTRTERSEAGDLRSDMGTRHRKVSFTLSHLNVNDRNSLIRMMRLVGVAKPIFISMYPNSDDAFAEEAYQMLCKLTDSGKISLPRYERYMTQLEFEEI